jgi:hypothetical protein
VCELPDGRHAALSVRGGVLCGVWGPVSKTAKVIVYAPRNQLDQAYEVASALWRQHQVEAETRIAPEGT